MKKMKMIKKYKLRLSGLIGLISLIIIVLSAFIIKAINMKITPKINEMIIFRVERMINSSVVSILDVEAFSNDIIPQVLKIEKNIDDEVISVDYDMALASQLLKTATDKINAVINDIDSVSNLGELFNYDYVDIKSNDIILLAPLGMASDWFFFGQLGPKVPVKINVMSDYYSTFESKVSDYGLNTILIELYLKIYVTNGILLNFNETKSSKEYTVLVASKVINGRIPAYYGGTIMQSSPLVTNEI